MMLVKATVFSRNQCINQRLWYVAELYQDSVFVMPWINAADLNRFKSGDACAVILGALNIDQLATFKTDF